MQYEYDKSEDARKIEQIMSRKLKRDYAQELGPLYSHPQLMYQLYLKGQAAGETAKVLMEAEDAHWNAITDHIRLTFCKTNCYTEKVKASTRTTEMLERWDRSRKPYLIMELQGQRLLLCAGTEYVRYLESGTMSSLKRNLYNMPKLLDEIWYIDLYRTDPVQFFRRPIHIRAQDAYLKTYEQVGTTADYMIVGLVYPYRCA